MFAWLGRKIKSIGRGISRIAGLSLTKRTLDFVIAIFTSVFIRKPTEQETFEEVVTRLKLTPKALEERENMFKIQILIYAISATAAGAYTLYLIIHGYWLSIAASVLVTTFLVICALKSHFWLFQMKHRKLGCTIEEWLNASIKESK